MSKCSPPNYHMKVSVNTELFYIYKSSYSKWMDQQQIWELMLSHTQPDVPITILGQLCCHASAAAKYSNAALMMQQQLLGEQESPISPHLLSNSAITLYNLRESMNLWRMEVFRPRPLLKVPSFPPFLIANMPCVLEKIGAWKRERKGKECSIKD